MKRYSIVIFLFLFVSLFVVGMTINSTQDVRSRAGGPTPTPMILNQKSVPPPGNTTIPPYIRLVIASESKDQLVLDVYTHTGGMAVSEVRTTLKVNESILAIEKNDITSFGSLPVRSINELSGGTVDVSFFADSEAGQSTLQTTTDTMVARLTFSKNGQRSAGDIHIVKESSGLYVKEGENANNILKSVEDAPLR